MNPVEKLQAASPSQQAARLNRRRLDLIEQEAEHWLRFFPADALRRVALDDGMVRIETASRQPLSEIRLDSTEREIAIHTKRYSEACSECGRVVSLVESYPAPHAAGCSKEGAPRLVEITLTSHADLDMTNAAFAFDMAALTITAPCPRCHRGSVKQTAGSTNVCEDCGAREDEYDRQARVLLADLPGDRRRSWADVERDVAQALRARAAERAALTEQVTAMKLRALAAHEAIWRTLSGRPSDALKSLMDDGDVHQAVHAIVAVETESVSAPEEWRSHAERQDRRIEALEAERAELLAEAERWREVARRLAAPTASGAR